MKTLLILLAAATFSGTEPTAPSANEKNAAISELKKSITFPEFAKKTAFRGIVAAEYVVTETGQVTVVALNASSEDLADYVKNKLESAVIDNCDAAGIYRSKFSFKYF